MAFRANISIFIFVCFIYGMSLETIQNTDGHFDCCDGGRVPWPWVCDGVEDCISGSDEWNCSRKTIRSMFLGDLQPEDCLRAKQQCSSATQCCSGICTNGNCFDPRCGI